jgi:hypothetical protein
LSAFPFGAAVADAVSETVGGSVSKARSGSGATHRAKPEHGEHLPFDAGSRLAQVSICDCAPREARPPFPLVSLSEPCLRGLWPHRAG